MNNGEILALAASLSLLNYVIGCLLLGFPIPFRGVKKWGPTLMKDAIFSATMVALSALILAIPGVLYNRLGADWADFDAWLTKRVLLLTSWKAGLAVLSGIVTKTAGGLVAESFFDPFVRSANYALLTLYLVLSTSIVVRFYYGKLILLGILLSSLPFRVAKGAGAYLIAFSIVFYAGLPLMPAFVEAFSVPLEEPRIDDEVAAGGVRIVDARGHPIPAAIVAGVDMATGRRLFTYTSNELGVAHPLDISSGLPKRLPYAVNVEVLGLNVNIEPNPVDPERDYVWHGGRAELVLVASNAYTLGKGCAVLLVNQGDVLLEAVNGSIYVFSALGFVRVLLSRAPGASLSVVGGKSTASYEVAWYGSNLLIDEIELEEGESVTVEVTRDCKPPSPGVYEPYTAASGLLSTKDRLTLLASQTLLNFVILPAVYVALLFAMASSVALLLGGARRSLPLKPW